MMFAYGFAQRALIAGTIIAVVCSLISFFVVVRRLAFAGMGISHAAFGGVALGLAAGIDPLLSAGGFCVMIVGIVAILALSFITIFFKELLFLSFDEETATASGLPVKFIYYGLLIVMALTIVVAIKLVGIVLVSALLVIPGATASQLSINYRGVLAWSVTTGGASVFAGLYLSFHFDVASGAAIVLVLFAVFLISMALSPRRRYMKRKLHQHVL